MTRSVAEKLGIRENTRLFVQNSPGDYIGMIGAGHLNIRISDYPSDEEMDVIHIFCDDVRSLEKGILEHKRHIKKNGAIWISWLKKSAGVKTDISDNNIRNFPLANGLVDIKVCSINETWSALKFVFRKKNR